MVPEIDGAAAPAKQPNVNVYKAIIVVLSLLVVALLGVIASGGRVPAAAPSAEPAVSPSSEAPPASPEPDPSQEAQMEEARRFLVETLPRRQESDPLAMGRVDAPVVLTEWADYRCPFCSVWAEDVLPGLQPLIDDGTVRIEFRDLAIFGEESIKAATAARAAGVQGKYFEFQHALFVALPNEGHPDIPDELVHGIVTDLGLDLEQFKADWADPAHRQAVLADTAEAQSLGIKATPAFVVGSTFISGAQPLAQFQAVIAQEAAS